MFSCQDITLQWQAASSFSLPHLNNKNIQKEFFGWMRLLLLNIYYWLVLHLHLSFSRDSPFHCVLFKRALENGLYSSDVLGHFFLFLALEKEVLHGCSNLFWFLVPAWTNFDDVNFKPSWSSFLVSTLTPVQLEEVWGHYFPDSLVRDICSAEFTLRKTYWSIPCLWHNMHLSWDL